MTKIWIQEITLKSRGITVAPDISRNEFEPRNTFACGTQEPLIGFLFDVSGKVRPAETVKVFAHAING